MTSLRTIEIDYEIYKLIQLERRGFEEPEYLALRRLLKIPETEEKNESYPTPSGRSWFGQGVELPHGTQLRMKYNGQIFRGQIDNGVWAVEGKRQNSPSAAAGAAASTKDGKHPSLNGWNYWEIKRPEDAGWHPLKSLRA